ncbi:MAG: DNA repair protein RadC [Anaerovoracaceae bacterium]
MQIKSLPVYERPIEKAVAHGINYLSNTELIALIIHTGTKNKSALHLAEDILSKDQGGISYLGDCSLEELTEISGIGVSKGCTILAAIELGKRISSAPKQKKQTVESSDVVANLFMEKLRYLKKEHFKSVLVNTKGEIILTDNVSVGELSSTVVHPREVFKTAIQKSAAAVIFIHNHPSGDPTPSQEDILTTKRLIEAGELLGIKVLDHIVIGDGEYTSLRGLGLV